MPDDQHSLANLTATAEALGLKGKNAASFTSEQLSFARDERARAREEERDRLGMDELGAVRQHEHRLAQLQTERPVAQIIYLPYTHYLILIYLIPNIYLLLLKLKMVKMAQGLFRQRLTVISQRQIFLDKVS